MLAGSAGIKSDQGDSGDEDNADGSESDTVLPPLVLASYNVWNSNPPKWVWRDRRDRWRQYNLRLYHLGDVLRSLDADIIVRSVATN
jgi:hypothetical protein